MKITSFVKSIILMEPQRPQPDRAGLQVGDRMVGKVLEVKGDHRAVVDFGRFRALSHLGFSVQKGEVINVEVVDKGVPLRLRRSGIDPELGVKTRKHPALGQFPSRPLLQELQTHMRQILPTVEGALKGKPTLGEFNRALKTLMAHFEPVDLRQHASEISGRLKQFMEDSGIFYEKKLEKVIEKFMHLKGDFPSKHPGEAYDLRRAAQKDVKSNLLILREFLSGKESLFKALTAKDPKGLRSAVERLLTETTARQEDAGAKPARLETAQVFTYLLPMKELEQDAEVKVYYPRKDRSKSKDEFRVSLLLTMEKTGPVRTDLFLKEGNLMVDFFVTEPTVKDYLDHDVEGLKGVLEVLFDTLSVRVTLSEKEIARFEFEDLTPSSDGLIDLKV